MSKHDTQPPIFRSLTLDQRHTPLETHVYALNRGDLDPSPPYQRGSVWGAERQRNLIWSLVIGLPIGAVFINDRGHPHADVVIDGKQRLLAVQRWMAGDLAVPASWFPRKGDHPDLPNEFEGETVTYDRLTRSAQRRFLNTGVAVYRTLFEGPDAEEREHELFDLINYGGVPQGESDREESR